MNYWLEVLAAISGPLVIGYAYYRVRLHEAKRSAEQGVKDLLERHHIDPRTITSVDWDKARGVTIHTQGRSYSERGGP